MKKRRVAQPVQVYLEPDDQARLERLARQLDTTKSDVLRRGIEAVERELLDPASHPALRLIGLVDAERPDAPPFDAAVEHDRALADSEEESWGASPRRPRPRRGR
jgi:hypothetical protein